MKKYLEAAPPANMCFLIPGLDDKHSYSLENLKCIITKLRKSWISLAGGAGTANIYRGGISGLSSIWNFNRRPLVFHVMHCWRA